MREVFEVVGAEDGVDGEFGAEGAKVAGTGYKGLRGEEDGEGASPRWLLDDFAAGGVQEGFGGEVGFVVG